MAVEPSTAAKARLSRMVAATVFPLLDDAVITDALVMYALADLNNVVPGEVGWVESFDWNGAAAECWGWKEGLASSNVNMSGDGRQASLSDIAEHCRERRKAFLDARATGVIHVYAE